MTSEKSPLAIKVEDVHKSFRLPTHRVDSLKERMVRPFSSRDYRELHALDGLSLEIHRGEFFGIVGRNGSGKSTLLKLLASIYRPDRGRLRIAGRLAPFIELGVGFNPELTARENVVLNGVMMGLTPKQMRERLGRIVAFAELEEFVDMKLKNYSSGMLVRLAFSVMMEADADILLIDEVLAVGDAAFQQKCADAFNEMKGAGKTIVLVTHDMATVEEYCHRAALISEGRVRRLGDPGDVARDYLRLNFEGEGSAEAGLGAVGGADDLRLLDAWLEDAAGERLSNLEAGTEIHIHTEVEALRETVGVQVGFTLSNEAGVSVFQFGAATSKEDGPILAGQRVAVEARIENLLAQGHYFVHVGAKRHPDPRAIVMHVERALDFLVFGNDPDHGMVALPHTVQTTVEARS